MTKQITVSKMETPKHEGDWHDTPLRWTATGPGAEVQNFSTKKSAMQYASFRRKSATAAEACNLYVRAA